MSRSIKKNLQSSFSARVALGYSVLGILWTLLDKSLFASDSENILSLLLQDWIFVFFSAVLLYLVLSRFERSGGRPRIKKGDALTPLVIDEADDGVVLLREDWIITDCNAGFCNLLGVDSPEEVIGRTLLDFMPELQWNGRPTSDLIKELERSIQDDDAHHVFWQHKQPSGQLMDVESSLKRIYRGDSVHILSVVRDMGSRLSMDRKRRRVERHNKVLLELHEKAQSLDDKELYDLVLDHAVALTGSEMGFLQMLSADQKPVHPTIWRLTDPVASKVEEGFDLLGDLGTWVDYELFSRPYINNDFSSSGASADLPGDGVSLRRFMSIPVVEEGSLRIIFAVCNKAEEYDELDSLQLQFVANELHKVMKQRLLMRELEERETALEEAQRIARMGSWVHDLQTNKVSWSKETYELFGVDCSNQSITLDRFAESVYPADREMVLGSYNEAIRNKLPYDVEHRIVRSDGEVRHVRERCEFYCAEDGTPLRSIGTIQDITERVEWINHIQREAEQNSFLLSVYERAEMLTDKELFFLVLDHAVSLTKSEIGVLLLISKDGKRIELVTCSGDGMDACAVFSEEGSLDSAGVWSDCVRKRSPVKYNDYPADSAECNLPDGHPKLHRMLAVPAQEKGSIGVVVGVGNKTEEYQELDLTQLQVVVQELSRILNQRYLLRALEEREASLKEAQRIARMGSWVHDIATGAMAWTDEVYKILGIEPENVEPSMEFTVGIIHPDDREWALASYGKSIEDRGVYEADYRVLRGEEVRYVHVRSVHEYTADGTPLRSVGTVQDVTDRVEAGEKVKLSERKYRLLFENMMVGFVLYEVVFDTDGNPADLRFAEVNPGFEEQTGIRAEDVMGRTVKDVLPSDFERWMEICSPVILTGKSCSSENYSAALESYFEIFAFQPEEGKCAIMILDVTDRKKALLKLSESEALQRNLIEAIPDLVWLKDRDGIYLSCNHAMEAFFEASESEIVGKTDYDFVDVSSADEFRLYDQQAAETDGPVTREELVTVKGGKTNLFESVRTPIWDARGNLIGILGIARDIGWRKKAEDELRKAKEQLEYIVENTHDTIYQVDLQGNYIYVNAAAEHTSGYAVEELLRMNIRDLVAPEDFPSVQGYMNQRFTGDHEPKSYSLQIVHKDGHRIWMELSSSGVYNERGELIALQGVARDVTERVQMHQALEKRLVALTRPSGEIGDIAFEDLFSLEDIQHLQDEFSAATGVSSVITSPDGTPITRFSNGSLLCTKLIQRSEIGKEKCRMECQAVGHSSADAPNIATCSNCGLWSAGASIVVGGTHVASWVIGQVRNESSDDEVLRSFVQEIGEDEDEFLRAYRELPIISEIQFERVANALFTLASQISDSAFMNLQQARFIVDERRRTEELRLLSTAISQATDAVMVTDANASIEYVNPAFEVVTGYSMEEVKGKNPRILSSGEHNESFYRSMWSSISSGKPWAGRIRNRRKDGSLYIEETTISPVSDAQGKIVSYVAVKHDITQLVRLEEQFRQNQKMEAIGRLASGVAHDFNNILQTIYGLCGVLLLDTVGQEGIQQDVREIHKAAKRAGELTKQLLTFSRKKPDSEIELSLNQVLDDQSSILARLLGDQYKLVLDCDPDLKQIVADVSQMEQVLMNLVINARDAMPDGGEIKVSTRNVTLADGEVSEQSDGGEFVCLSVIDSGTGMEKEVVDSLFEPFFTTKPIGEGTGLGLALIYSIVERVGGWIHVDSTVGEGSVFTVYLPVNRRLGSSAHLAGGDKKETRILLVENDSKIHKFVTMILSGSGYSVEGVESGAQAVKASDEAEQGFDLLVVGEMLPDGCGLDLADNIALRNSKMSVLVLGERGDNSRGEKAIEQRGCFFLKKPFSTEALINIVELALQRSAGKFH